MAIPLSRMITAVPALFFICITFKLIPNVYGERDVGGRRILLMNLSENKKIIGIQQPEIKKTVGALSGAATRSLENDDLN